MQFRVDDTRFVAGSLSDRIRSREGRQPADGVEIDQPCERVFDYDVC